VHSKRPPPPPRRALVLCAERILATMLSIETRLAGGLLGLLVGDALGVPYEFHRADQLPPREQLELEPPPGFRRAHPGTPPGTWSDDGAQALCLLDSLLARGAFDAGDFARRLVNRAGERENGNGALMRVLPLALWHTGSDAALVADAHAQSRVTHGHARSQVACALYCLWARRTLDGAPDAWREAVATLRGLYDHDTAHRRELDDVIRPDDAPRGRGSGYVVDCLHSARASTEAGGYEDVVRAAIALGDDTDTTACVAGGIAGLRDGVDAIPARWRDHLRGRELYAPLLESLVASRARNR
jgi:ADP-ribosylglycohydrolase